MRENFPQSISDTVHELAPDAIAKLYEIKLSNGAIIRLCPTAEVTWQGNLYEEVPCNLVGLGQSSDSKVNRPKFSFVNPEGVFTAQVYNGVVDNALITRIRILKADLDADNDFAIRETFKVSRIMQLGQQMVTLELRDVMDGHQFKLPARQYLPPEFPHVKLR
jgi:phage-related protein